LAVVVLRSLKSFGEGRRKKRGKRKAVSPFFVFENYLDFFWTPPTSNLTTKKEKKDPHK
jgi:hypothetical protein